MKKIMFNDKYGLTESVLTGRKTMTRRIVSLCENDLNFLKITERGEWLFSSSTCLDGAYPAYKIGEEIAIAQPYKDICLTDPIFFEGMRKEAGWSNKMFVKAEYMPHRIRITGIKVERLQDISDEDAMREGVYKHNAAPDALGMDRYKFIAYAYNATPGKNIKRWWFQTPREAFAALIDRICGRGTWKSNPWMYAYEFELIKWED